MEGGVSGYGRDAGNGEVRDRHVSGGEMSNRDVNGGRVGDTEWIDGLGMGDRLTGNNNMYTWTNYRYSEFR